MFVFKYGRSKVFISNDVDQLIAHLKLLNTPDSSIKKLLSGEKDYVWLHGKKLFLKRS